jgi:hypothetical protein
MDFRNYTATIDPEQIRGPASSRDRKIAFIKRDSYIFIDIYKSSTKNVLLLVLYLVDLCLFFLREIRDVIVS